MRRSMSWAIAAAACAFLSPASAEDCGRYLTQGEMNACAARSYERADAALNAVYRALRERSDAAAGQMLVQAQRAWIAFRDAECAYAAREAEGGSIYPLLLSGCLETLTAKRTEELRAHLGCDLGDPACKGLGADHRR